MGNQQPSPLVALARNAKVGDGFFWKHPECVNYKIIFNSIDLDWLEVKRSIYPKIFTTGPKPVPQKSRKCFPNARPLYRLSSLIHPVFTEYASRTRNSVMNELTLQDFGLWYLDDGCCIHRNDGGSYRFILSIGDICSNPLKELAFRKKLISLFGKQFGRITLNNSKATVRNKSLILRHDAAKKILREAVSYKVMPRKFPPREWFND